MNRYEFIENLMQALKNNISDKELNNQLDYYKNYINDEISKGRKESEIVDELGDPKLIAKTIISLQNDNDNSEKPYTNDNMNEDNNHSSNNTIKRNYSSLGCALSSVIMLILILGIFRIFGAILSGTFYVVSGVIGPIGIIIVGLFLFYLFRNKQ